VKSVANLSSCLAALVAKKISALFIAMWHCHLLKKPSKKIRPIKKSSPWDTAILLFDF
jgi:hypothetical protein